MRRTGGALAVLALVLGGCRSAVKPGPAPAGAQPPLAADAAEAIRHGTAYLLAHQNPDGSWGSFDVCHVHELYLGDLTAHEGFSDAVTALCTMALMNLPEGDPAVRKALDRGLEQLVSRPPAPRPSADAIYNIWGHTYALQCLAQALRDPRWAAQRERIAESARRQITALALYQSALGGWAYYDFTYQACRTSGAIDTSFSTAAALVALDEARKAGLEIPPVMIREGAAFLASLRNGNGAYLYSFGHRYHPNSTADKIKGSLGRSQAGNCAMARFGDVVGEREIVQSLENFFTYHHFIEIGRQRQFPHEGWYATAPYYYYFGHYYAALNIAGLPVAERARYTPKLEAILCGTQEPDGAWWDFPMYGYSKPYGTGLAMLGLEALR